jgi:hypothetical protein
MKLWGTTKADKEFSKMIRARDRCCQRCGSTTNLQCSHFWSRNHSSVRYDVENCITLCAGCHYFKWETEKQGAYRDFMLSKLGELGYAELRERAMKLKSRRDAIKEFQLTLTRTK